MRLNYEVVNDKSCNLGFRYSINTLGQVSRYSTFDIFFSQPSLILPTTTCAILRQATSLFEFNLDEQIFIFWTP